MRAAGPPDLGGVTDMSGMFRYAHSLTDDLSNCDMSGVTDMSRTFLEVRAFNRDISGWTSAP